MRTLRAGTRASRLALAQTEIVSGALNDRFALQPQKIITAGDRHGFTGAGDGAFVKELQRSLLACKIDCAIHSLKDVPTEPVDGLLIAAVLKRGDPRDALVGHSLTDLPVGARVGTGSPRRSAQLRALRPDVTIIPIRGNVPTRVRKVHDGEIDAAMLALAGLHRLQIVESVHALSIDQIAPAPGQGAIAIEVRADDTEATLAFTSLDHLPTRMAVEAERAVLRALGGGCLLPVGAYAEVDADHLSLMARVVSSSGVHVAQARQSGPVSDRHAIALDVAARLVEQNAKELLDG